MTWAESLYTYLAAYSALTDLVSTRIHHHRPDQDPTYPLVTFLQLGRENAEAMGATALVRREIRVTAWSRVSPDEALSVGAQVYAALQRFSGAMGGGITVSSCLLSDEQDESDDEGGVFSVPQHFTLYHL